MSRDEQKVNPYNSPTQRNEQGLRSFIFVVLFVTCLAMVLVSLALSGHAIWKILRTTPAMGIPVDAWGNRIPVQGYPQLWFGLMGVILFSILAAVFGLYRKENPNLSQQRPI